MELQPDIIASHLLDSASRAPSAHNTQPWLLKFEDSQVEIFFDKGRRIPEIDPADTDLKHALGVVLENMLLTLTRLGMEASYEIGDVWSSKHAVIVLRWKQRDSAPTADELELERAIPLRSTSRLAYDQDSLDEKLLSRLAAITEPPCELHVLTDRAAIDRVRQLTARADAMQLGNSAVATELYEWLRFSRRDSRWFRDGLNADCMGWKRWEAWFARLLTHPVVLSAGRYLGLPKLLCANVNQQAPPTPALCLLTVRSNNLQNRIEAGRILQRVWLTAAKDHYFTHPLSSAIETAGLREQILDQFGLPHGTTHVNLFRLGRSRQPARSARLPADELLVV